MSKARLIPVAIICDRCWHMLRRSLHDVGWKNAIICPKCQGMFQIESGANAIAITAAMRKLHRLHPPRE
jgi:hypothetical protein